MINQERSVEVRHPNPTHDQQQRKQFMKDSYVLRKTKPHHGTTTDDPQRNVVHLLKPEEVLRCLNSCVCR